MSRSYGQVRGKPKVSSHVIGPQGPPRPVEQRVAIAAAAVMSAVNRQPTIKIRAGWPLRVLVNKDMILAPYP